MWNLDRITEMNEEDAGSLLPVNKNLKEEKTFADKKYVKETKYEIIKYENK